MAALDFEMKASYSVDVTATDPSGLSATVMVTIMVTNVDEMGMVTLSAMQPTVGMEIMATLTDPDMVVDMPTVMWQWASSDAMDGTYTDIEDDATSASYMPVDVDENMYLRATAMYTDGEGSGKMAMSAMTAKVVAADAVDAVDPLVADLLDKFDTNPQNGQIDKSEVVDAIIAFVTPGASNKPSKKDIVDLIVHFVTTPR